MTATSKCQRPQRRGFTFVELTAAMVMLSMIMLLAAGTLGAMAQQERATERQLLATQEAAAAMERLMARPYSALGPDSAAQLKLSPVGAARLPRGTLTATISEVPVNPAAKRVSVEVTWINAAGQTPAVVRLTAWNYGSTETKP